MSLSSALSSPESSPRRSSRRVSFDDNASFIPSAIPSSPISERWYDANDLNNFKTEARSLCRELRENATLFDMQVCVRGLEQRISLERQRNKCLTVRCILKAQQRYAGQPEQLARIAAKCTAWAQQLAQTAAQQDYQQVYEDDSNDGTVSMSSSQQLLLLATPTTPLVAFPLTAFHLKRRCSVEAEEDELSTGSTQQRHVRQRVQ